MYRSMIRGGVGAFLVSLAGVVPTLELGNAIYGIIVGIHMTNNRRLKKFQFHNNYYLI